jgi:DNA-binding XRE family transcriptional regulator
MIPSDVVQGLLQEAMREALTEYGIFKETVAFLVHDATTRLERLIDELEAPDDPAQRLQQLAQNPDRLRELRIRAHLTQAQLARRAGLAQSTVSRAERGMVLTDPKTLHVLAKALGYAVDHLMADQP